MMHKLLDGNALVIGLPPTFGSERKLVMSKPSKHVVPSSTGGWAVKNAGSTRASKTFDTQQQAVDYGRTAAKKVGTELYIHGRDGTIKDKRSYGNDPIPPRDKK
jgi:hypothetical protein